MKSEIVKKVLNSFKSKKNILLEKICKKYGQSYSIVPTQVTIEISGNCNAKCPFCFRQAFDSDLKGFMPKAMFYDIVKQIQKIPTIKIVALATTGEPLLHPDFDEFVDYLSKLDLGYEIMFPTNMSLAHKHFDSLLKTKRIIYSIEGHDRESYERLRKNLSFDQVYQNVKELDTLIKDKRQKGEHSPVRLLNFIVTKNSKIKEHLALWGDYVDAIRISPMGYPRQWNEELGVFVPVIIKEMENEIIQRTQRSEKTLCTQPFDGIVIRTTGKLSLCCSDSGCKLDFGDYKNLKKSFLKNKNLNKIREELKQDKLIACKNCNENFIISKEILAEYLPELKNIDSKRIRVY